MRKSKLKRTMSMLLTVLMVFMSMNFSVFAEELSIPQTEPEITTNELTKTTAEDPSAITSSITEEEQTPAVLSSNAAKGAVADEEALRQAIENAKDGDTIDIDGYIELSSSLVINKAITLHGADMYGTIIAKNTEEWSTSGDKSSASLIVIAGVGNGAVNLENMTVMGAQDITLNNPDLGTAYGHGINVYRSSNVTLKNVFSTTNSGAGLIVNGSTVDAQYLMTADNGWYSVNVEKSDTFAGKFTLSSDSVLGDAVQIQSDKGDVTVNALGYSAYKSNADEKTIWSNADPATFLQGKAYIENKASDYTVYDSIQAAVDAVSENGTVYLGVGKFNAEALSITKSMNLVGAGKDSTILTEVGKNNTNTIDIKYKDGMTVKISDIQMTGSFVAGQEGSYMGIAWGPQSYSETKPSKMPTLSVDNCSFNSIRYALTFFNLKQKVNSDYTAASSYSDFQIKNCSFNGNGVNIYYPEESACYNSTSTVSGNTFDGGVFLGIPLNATIENNTFTNIADGRAAIQFLINKNTTVAKTTIQNNSFISAENAEGYGVELMPYHSKSEGAEVAYTVEKAEELPTIKNNRFLGGTKALKNQVYRSGSKELIYYANNVIDLSKNFEAATLDDQGHAASADIDKKDYANDYTAPIMTLYPYYLDSSMAQESGAPVSVEKEGIKTGYATLAEAVNAAPENATVTINDNITVDAAAGGAVQVTKPMTITAVEGVKVTTKKAVADDSEYLFNVSGNDVTIKGLDIDVDSHAGGGRLDVIYTSGNNTVIENCTVTGLYEGATTDDNHVTGAVMPQTGTTGLRVENCTFNNIYYAGYFQAAGELINNKMVNTRALLLMQDSNYTVTGNQFEGLTTDIAIVNSGNNTETNAYTDLAKLSKENNNAKVGDYMKNTYAENGSYAVTAARADLFGITKEAMLQAAVNGVPDNAAILAEEGTYTLDAKLNITKPLTLEGVGTVIITKGNADWTSTGDGSDAMLVNIENTNNVTLKKLTVTGAEDIMADGSKKASGSGINVYNSETITLENVTSTNNVAAGVIVNSSSVTATDLQTSGNAWGGVNVDQKTDKAASFTLSGNSSLAEPAPIYSEKADQVTVDAKTAEGAPYVATKMGNVTVWSVTSDLTNKVYTLDDNQIATIYGSIEDAVKALENGGTIYLGESTDNNSFSIGYDVTLPDNITIQGTGDKASVVSLDYNGSNGSGSIEKSGTIITGVATKLKNITFKVTKPNRTGSSAAFSVYKTGFAMENCTVNVAGSVNDNYYIFDTNTLPADATVSITDSVFTSEVKVWTVYSGDISKQKTLAGKLTFTGNTITGNFSAVLSQITGAYDIIGNTANLTADDACLTDLMAVGSTWTNIQYGSVITNNTLTTQNTHGTDALIRILPIRRGSKVQALPAVMQEGFMPTVSGNTQTAEGEAVLPVYNVNMKRVHNNLATLRLQGALGDGAVVYTTYDNTATQGQPYVVTDAPIMGKTSGGATKFYDNLQTAINEVGNGGTVTIPYTQDGYTYNGNINIRDGVTVEVAKSAETQGTAKINGQVTIDNAKNVTLNNVSVETTTGSATGAIVTKQGASVTINNASVVNKGTEAGTCGIRMEGESDSVTLNGVDITAKYYGVGVRNSKQNLTVNASELTGWAAIMTSNGGSQEPTDRDVTITVTNSKLYGLHASNASAAEGYATVVLQENFENVTFTAENTLIYAGVGQYASNDNTGLYQYGMDIRPYGNAITLTNCQFQMENAEAKIINAHDNRVSGDNYKEKAEATDANKNNFILDGITLMDKDGNPVTPTADQKLIGARVRFGGVKQDVFTLSNTDLTESNIEWTRLDPTGNHIQVSNQEELEWIADQVNSGKDTFADKTIELLNDITLTGEWTPIGKDDSTKAFSGVFDGQKHTISGLTVDTADGFAGLFGAVNGGATIKNLKIDNANITTAGKNAGVLAGGTTYANQKSLTIENITVTNSNVTALGRAGGIIGWIKDSVKPVSITSCTVENTNILMTNDATGGEGDKAGGIVGQASSPTTISGCTVQGNSAISGFRDIGGIAGYISQGTKITGCTVAEGTTVKADVIDPLAQFQPRNLAIGVGGIIGTYNGTACSLSNNTVAATLEAGSYDAGDGIVTYKGQYYGAPRSGDAAITCEDANNAEISVYGETGQAEKNGAALKQIVDKFAQAGDTINLAKGDYTSADAITIGKAVTINGLDDSNVFADKKVIDQDGVQPQVVINGRIDVQANAVLNNLTLKDKGAVKTAVIYTKTPGLAIEVNNCYIQQDGEGTAADNGYAGRSSGIIVDTEAKGTKLNVNGSFVELVGEKGHFGICAYAPDMELNLTDSKVLSNNTYDRGITYGGDRIKSTLENSEVNVSYYGLNINGKNGNIAVNNSKVIGYAAFNIHGASDTITVTSSTLTGRTYNPEAQGWNTFGTVVFNGGANDTHVTVDGDSIVNNLYMPKNDVMADSMQYLVDMRNDTASFTMNSGKMEMAYESPGSMVRFDLYTKGTVTIADTVAMVYDADSSEAESWQPCIKVVDGKTGSIKNAARSVANALYRKEFSEGKALAWLNVNPDNGDTLVIPDTTVITEDIDMTTIGKPYELDTENISINGVNIKTDGNVTFNGSFSGSTAGKLIVPVGKTETFNGDVKNFVTVQLDGSGVSDGTNQSVIQAKGEYTDQNSFVKGGNATFEFTKAATPDDYNTWTATHRTDVFDTGDGTEANPYQIAVPEQLYLMYQKIDANDPTYVSAHYKLTADMTLPADMDLVNGIGHYVENSADPDGAYIPNFTGTFNGQNHTITMNESNGNNLFNVLGEGGVIKNLKYISPKTLVSDNRGTVEQIAFDNQNVAGQYPAALTWRNSGTVQNCYTNGCLAGWGSDSDAAGQFINCYTTHDQFIANNDYKGTLTNTYYQGAATDYANHVVSAADMQKARFAMILDGSKPGSEKPAETPNWTYVPNAEGTAYPQLQWEAVNSKIEKIAVSVENSSEGPTAPLSKVVYSVNGIENAPVYYGDAIKVKATWNELHKYGQYFDGWFDKTTDEKVLANMEDSMVVKAATTLVAKTAETPKRSVTTISRYGDIAINGKPADPEGFEATAVPVGEEIKITVTNVPDGYEFAYWWDTNAQKIVSTDMNYTFTMPNENITLNARFIKKAPEQMTVTFYQSNGSVCAVKQIEKGSTLDEVPDPYELGGYTFVGWKDLNNADKIYTKEELRQLTIGSNMEFRAVYKATTTVKVSVINGTINNSAEPQTMDRGAAFTLKANAAELGKKFEAWRIENASGQIIGYNPEMIYYVPADATLYASYVDESTEVAKEVQLYLNPTTIVTPAPSAAGQGSVKFYAQRILPEGCTLVECGLIVSRDGESLTADNLTLETAGANGIIKGRSSSQSVSGQYNITLTKISVGKTGCARAYMQYKDANGALTTVYSDIAKGRVDVMNQ